MYLVLALLSAITASLVAIFGKLGVKDLDPMLATTIRSSIMAIFLIVISAVTGKIQINSLTHFQMHGIRNDR